GDRVLAYDEETGETAYQLVTATWAHEDPVLVYVTVSGERIETTPEHPFSVVGRGWVKASDLRPGDRIHRAFGGTGPVTSVTVARQPQVMYNLTVDAAHTFFVGDDAWLVHNTGGRGTALSGRQAEQIVAARLGVPHNTIPPLAKITGPGSKVWYPDFDPRITIPKFGTLDEVKDYVRLKTTRQLKRFHAEAQALGGKLRIHTDGRLPTRGWLAQRVARGEILIAPIRC
ncbi:MAG: hypothetical protein IT193_14655, partial [Propionibacteriaceae bacterium]|nr:hypothetical protein [Propionibacteriaceae bacterium]